MRKAPRKLSSEDEIYECAVRALARRMRSVAELKRVLRSRAAPGSQQTIDVVITRLKEQRYLNDSAYAAAYAGFRRDNEKLGARRVISDLKSRGVHPDVIEKEVRAAYSACEEQTLARDFLRRKRVSRPQSDRDAARIFRALMRAGFSARVALGILKEWDVEDEVVSALETEAE